MRKSDHIRNNMRAVKASGSEIEKKIGKAFRKANIRYLKNYTKLPGKPDFILFKFKVAIFCDSHFWHGYNWDKRKHDHKTNKKFWYNKIERNIERDKEVNTILNTMGWNVIRFWEHEIKEDVEKCILKVKEVIDSK